MAFRSTANLERVSGPATGTTYQKGGVAFWFKTSSTTANMVPISRWSGSSREGWGFIVNNVAGKMTAVAYDGGTARVSCNGVTTINDGAWHHMAFNFDGATSGAGQTYIDGASEASNSLTGTWSVSGANSPMYLFDNNDNFWPTFIGSMAEMVEIYGRNFTDGEIAALAKGYSPKRVVKKDSSTSALAYWPMIRDMVTVSGSPVSVLSSTVNDVHPRVY